MQDKMLAFFSPCIKVVRVSKKRYRADTIADMKLLQGAPKVGSGGYFDVADYDTVLEHVSQHGYSIETSGDEIYDEQVSTI